MLMSRRHQEADTVVDVEPITGRLPSGTTRKDHKTITNSTQTLKTKKKQKKTERNITKRKKSRITWGIYIVLYN